MKIQELFKEVDWIVLQEGINYREMLNKPLGWLQQIVNELELYRTRLLEFEKQLEEKNHIAGDRYHYNQRDQNVSYYIHNHIFPKVEQFVAALLDDIEEKPDRQISILKMNAPDQDYRTWLMRFLKFDFVTLAEAEATGVKDFINNTIVDIEDMIWDEEDLLVAYDESNLKRLEDITTKEKEKMVDVLFAGNWNDIASWNRIDELLGSWLDQEYKLMPDAYQTVHFTNQTYQQAMLEITDAIDRYKRDQAAIKKSVMINYSDGLAWYNLGVCSDQDEGKLMGHCGMAASPAHQLLSLRRYKESGGFEPYVTATLDERGEIYDIVGKVKGGAGMPPPDEALHPYIMDLLLHPDITGIRKHTTGFKIEQLSDEQIKKLAHEKPNILPLPQYIRIFGYDDFVKSQMSIDIGSSIQSDSYVQNIQIVNDKLEMTYGMSVEHFFSAFINGISAAYADEDKFEDILYDNGEVLESWNYELDRKRQLKVVATVLHSYPEFFNRFKAYYDSLWDDPLPTDLRGFMQLGFFGGTGTIDSEDFQHLWNNISHSVYMLFLQELRNHFETYLIPAIGTKYAVAFGGLNDETKFVLYDEDGVQVGEYFLETSDHIEATTSTTPFSFKVSVDLEKLFESIRNVEKVVFKDMIVKFYVKFFDPTGILNLSTYQSVEKSVNWFFDEKFSQHHVNEILKRHSRDLDFHLNVILNRV